MKFEAEYDKHDKEHAKNPKVGDYWHDMFSPVAVVVEVSKHSLVICRTTKQMEDETWTWNLEKLEPVLRKDFEHLFQYGRIDNKSFTGTADKDHISNKYWADVIPTAHKWVKECLDG